MIARAAGSSTAIDRRVNVHAARAGACVGDCCAALYIIPSAGVYNSRSSVTMPSARLGRISFGGARAKKHFSISVGQSASWRPDARD